MTPTAQPGQASISQAQTVDRATQGFVANLSWLRRHPAVIALEVAWRWLFGIPAFYLIYRIGARIFAATPWQVTGITNISANQLLTDPLAASTTVANFAAIIGPGVYAAAAWLAPLLFVLWAVISGLGRTLVLKRMDRTLHTRPATLIILQLFRILPLAAAFALWWLGLLALARVTILNPVAAGADPAMMLYVGGAIALTLGLFILSAITGWVFSIAPILAMLNNTGPARSLRDALHIGHLRSGLIEINMVMGIVKIALLVLAMVFSATPLPFQSVVTDDFLLDWNIAVAICYCLVSDVFHVARLSSYLHLWHNTRAAK